MQYLKSPPVLRTWLQAQAFRTRSFLGIKRLPHRFVEPFLVTDCQDVAQLRQLEPRQTVQMLRSVTKKGLDEHA